MKGGSPSKDQTDEYHITPFKDDQQLPDLRAMKTRKEKNYIQVKKYNI